MTSITLNCGCEVEAVYDFVDGIVEIHPEYECNNVKHIAELNATIEAQQRRIEELEDALKTLSDRNQYHFSEETDEIWLSGPDVSPWEFANDKLERKP